MWGFTIHCGHCDTTSPFEKWIERPSGYRLPDDCFQCPVCAVAIKRVLHRPTIKAGAPVPWYYGSYITLEKIPAWL